MPWLHYVPAAGGPTDPNFASVSLLLRFNETNGSLALTDSSSYADSKTVTAGASVSTSSPKWGSGSLLNTYAQADVPAWSGHMSAMTTRRKSLQP